MAIRGGFRPAYTVSGGVPQVTHYTYTAAQTFKTGDVLIFASGGAGTVEVDTSDPTPIVGVAAEPAASHPGNSMGFNADVQQVTGGHIGEVAVWIANRDTVFQGLGSTTVPLTTHIDTPYGIAVTSNVWRVDLTDESATRVEIVAIDDTENLYFFKFMEAHLALP